MRSRAGSPREPAQWPSAKLRVREVPGQRPETVAVALLAALDAVFGERLVLVATRDGLRRIDLAGVDTDTWTLADVERLLSSVSPDGATGGGHLVSTVSWSEHTSLVSRLDPASSLHVDARTGSATLSVRGRDDLAEIAAVAERCWLRAAEKATGPLQEVFADHAVATERVDDQPDLFVTRFTALCAEAPNRVAVETADGVTTYGELERIADSIAWQLEQRGIGRGHTLFVVPNRDRILVAMLVAAFKTGATLALSNPSLPLTYLQACVDAARADLVVDLAGTGLPGAVPFLEAATIAGPPSYVQERLGPDDPAFVTFTSGTSGAPKGVLGRYGSLTHFFDWMDDVLGPLRGARFGMCSSLGHDPLQRDIMTPLYLGGTICIPDEPDLTDVGAFPRWLADERIEVICVNPSAIGLMAQATELPALRRVFCVGTALTRGQVRDLMWVAPRAQVVNLYGSTETQRAVGYYRVPKAWEELPLIVPVGAGMKDAELLVVTPGFRRCLPFQRGQIAIRSRHVGLGYIGDAELTAARFRTDVPAGEDPVPTYLSGDIGYRSPRHGVVFTGREDAQVKVNGHRVELEQVTETCRDHPLVRDVATVAVDVDGHLTLATFLVPTEQSVQFDPPAFRADLAEKLPGYMVPHRVATVPELPLTHNHKVDTAKLGEWARQPSTARPAGLEATVRDFVRRHSGLDETPVDVPLANLGIDSLRFASLVSQFGDRSNQNGQRLNNTMTAAELTSALAGAPPVSTPRAGGAPPEQPLVATVRRLVGHASRVTETTVEVRGRRLDHLCSNSYLGLSSHPLIRERVAEFVGGCTSYGSHGSGEVNGHTEVHERLTASLKEIFGSPAVTLYSSGYLANVSAIPAVVGPDGMLFVDEFSHRSILDGCVLSGAQMHVYRHNDPDDLFCLLSRTSAGPGSVIVTEAVFGSTGGVADLPSLASCARAFGCTLYVDEASSLGQLGATGRGIEEHFGMPGCVDVRAGSLAKALASNGGFVTSRASVADLLLSDRGATFATSISPIDAFVAAEAARVLVDHGSHLVSKLDRNRGRWRSALRAAGFDTGTSASAIVPIMTSRDDEVASWFSAVLDAGALVLPLSGNWSTQVRALRTTVTAVHDPAALPELAERLATAVAGAGSTSG